MVKEGFEEQVLNLFYAIFHVALLLIACAVLLSVLMVTFTWRFYYRLRVLFISVFVIVLGVLLFIFLVLESYFLKIVACQMKRSMPT